MKLEILEEKLEHYNSNGTIEELDDIQNFINGNYETLKNKLYLFKEVYHFVFIYQSQLDQEDLGIEVHQKIGKFIEDCEIRRNKKILKEVKELLRFYPIMDQYNFYYKKLIRMTDKQKLDYLYELFKDRKFYYSDSDSDHFSLNRDCSRLIFTRKKNAERISWFLNYHSEKLFQEIIDSFESLTNSEINKQIIEIQNLIYQSKEIPKNLDNNYFDFNENNMHEAYHIARNINFYSKLNIYVYSKRSEIVIAYTQINKTLPYLKDLLSYRLENKNKLVSQELITIYKTILDYESDPKGWFVAGVLLATGRVKEEWKKFDYNFSQLSKELFNEKAKKYRPYLSTSYVNKKGKENYLNVFCSYDKLIKVKEFCNRKDIDISSTFYTEAKKQNNLID